MNWDDVSNYDREVSFQGRLDKTLDRQKVKLRDNLVKLTGTPEDVIVLKTKRTQNGDTISKVVVDQKLLNMIFPPLKDVPVRRISTEFREGYVLNSMVSAHGGGSEKGQDKEQKDLTKIEVIIPLDSDLDIDDTVVRVFVQEKTKQSTVVILNVVEILSDFSTNSPLTLKAILAISTEPVDLTKPLYKLITTLAKRRLEAGY